jgi:hypothetical protein
VRIVAGEYKAEHPRKFVEITQSHGAEILREALEEGLKVERFDVRFVEEKLQGKLNFSEVKG